MGGASGNRQFFTINAGADLTMSGKLSGTTGVELTKDGVGNLVLSNDNSGFTGPIVISTGILKMTNARALGDTSSDTTVQTNAQLQVSDIAAAIKEDLIVNASGVIGDGALLNVSGNNTWVGNIVMDSDTTFGASANSSLDITGQISDTGAGHNLTKEGKAGQESFIILSGEAEVTLRGESVALLGSGDFFGEIALVTSVPRTATVAATSPVRALVVTDREFRHLLEESPDIKTRVMQAMAARLAPDTL